MTTIAVLIDRVKMCEVYVIKKGREEARNVSGDLKSNGSCSSIPKEGQRK